MTPDREELRPRPERPEFNVEPLRPRQEPSRNNVAFRMTLGAWVAVTIVALALSAVIATHYDAVRSALETTVAQNDSGATPTAVADTVTVTLLGSAAVAALLIILAAVGLGLASTRKAVSGIVLLIAGLGSTGAFVLFWSFMSDAGSIAAGALQWGPLVGAGVAAIAAVAAGTGLTRK